MKIPGHVDEPLRPISFVGLEHDRERLFEGNRPPASRGNQQPEQRVAPAARRTRRRVTNWLDLFN